MSISHYIMSLMRINSETGVFMLLASENIGQNVNALSAPIIWNFSAPHSTLFNSFLIKIKIIEKMSHINYHYINCYNYKN